MSAFSNSPGGCCCNGGGWWEEWATVGLEVTHNGSHPTPGTPDPTGTNGFFYRVGSMAPSDVGAAEYDSWARGVYYEPDIPIEKFLWFRGEDTRWSVEQPSDTYLHGDMNFAAYLGGGPVHGVGSEIMRVPFSQFTGFSSMPEPTNFQFCFPGVVPLFFSGDLLSVNVTTLVAISINPGDSFGSGYLETNYATADGSDGYVFGPQAFRNTIGPYINNAGCARFVIADTTTQTVTDKGVKGIVHYVSNAIAVGDYAVGGINIFRTPSDTVGFPAPPQILETTYQALCAVSPHWNMGASIRYNDVGSPIGGIGLFGPDWIPAPGHHTLFLEFSAGPLFAIPVSRSGGEFWGVTAGPFLRIQSDAVYGRPAPDGSAPVPNNMNAPSIYGQWLWFDSYGPTWAGVIEYANLSKNDPASGVDNDHPSGTNYKITQALYINGVEIKKITFSEHVQLNRGFDSAAVIHPCIGYPSVICTGNAVAVVQVPFSPEPKWIAPDGDNVIGFGNNEPIAKAARDPLLHDDFYKLVIYEAGTGSQIYVSPDLTATTVIGSSERWIYVVSGMRDSVFTHGRFQDRFQGTAPNGVVLGPPGTPPPRGSFGARLWLVSHSGSEVIPTGTITIDPSIIFGDLEVWHDPVETEPPRFVTYDTPLGSGFGSQAGPFYGTSEYTFARPTIPSRHPNLWTGADIISPPDNFQAMFDAHA